MGQMHKYLTAAILKKRIEDGTLGRPAPEPLGEGGSDLHYFLLGDNAFSLIPWLVTPYRRRKPSREESIATTGFPEAGQ